MPKAYTQSFETRPNKPGFWYDAWLTNYGCQVVQGPQGLVALGWAADPTPIEKLPQGRPEDAYGNPQAGGWYGPFPVPSHRRYEIRKLRESFRNDPIMTPYAEGFKAGVELAQKLLKPR